MYELLNEGADWFFTMELVEGVDFLTYVRGGHQTDRFLPSVAAASGEDRQTTVTLIPGPNPGRSRFDLARLRAATAQLVRGLCALHQAGKLHRDLKPSNVLVDSSDRVVILDFGLVSELSPEVAPTAAGTPGFMAPEQAAHGTVTEASDWYSVGVMLYQVLTGRLPRRDSAGPAAPGDSADSVPEDLNKLVHDLLQVDPSARPSGAEVLARLQMERPVAARAQSPFVGRAEELQALRAAYGGSRSQPVVLLVHGGSGIGKSALVTHFLNSLREEHPEAIVLTGRCYQRESMPHKAIDSLIDALALYLKRLRTLEAEGLMPRDIAALAQLFPVLRQVESVACARRRPVEAANVQEQRRRAFSALKELLARMADGSLRRHPKPRKRWRSIAPFVCTGWRWNGPTPASRASRSFK